MENDSVFSGVVSVIDISLESRQPDVTAECRTITSTRIMQWCVSLVKRLVEVSLQVQRCRGDVIGEHYARLVPLLLRRFVSTARRASLSMAF